VFGYSDEEGTEAAGFDDKVDADEVAARIERITRLADELMAQRADERIGTRVEVLVESRSDDADGYGDTIGRAAHQGPDVDGVTTLTTSATRGELVTAVVVASDGVDLVAEPVGARW